MQMEQYAAHSKQPLGTLKLNYVIYFYLALVLLAPAYTYHMSVKNKQEPPFPHTTVTKTACHYPQAQVFRWAMTSAGCFLTLIFHVIFRWFERQAKRYEYPGPTFGYMYWPCILSVLGYLAAISTIDIGGTGMLHIVGSVYFFILLYVMVLNFSIIAKKMRRWDIRFMSRPSLLIKCTIAAYLTVVQIYCIIGLLLEGAHANDDDRFLVIVEWNLVYAGLIWVLSFVPDFKDLYLSLNPHTMRIGIVELPQ